MAKLILFNKPYGVLSQFSGPHPNLSDHISEKDCYPAGRLDKDSEGLLLLTDDGKLQARIAEPKHKMPKTYWVQVEGIPDSAALGKLQSGVELKDGMTKSAKVTQIDCPLPPRDPPIRERKNIPTTWLELVITEGRNRQVRRMTAAVDLPTLRLYRAAIGPWSCHDIEVGQYQVVQVNLPRV